MRYVCTYAGITDYHTRYIHLKTKPYSIENLNDPVTRIQSRWRMNGRAKVIIGNSDTMNAEHTLIYNNNLVKQYSDIASRRLTAMYHILYLQSVPSPNPAWFRIFVTFFSCLNYLSPNSFHCGILVPPGPRVLLLKAEQEERAGS